MLDTERVLTSSLSNAIDIVFLCLVPPNIAGMDESQDFTVLRNRQVTLECKSDAVPPPVIMWLKNGEQLQVTLLLDSTYPFVKGKNS